MNGYFRKGTAARNFRAGNKRGCRECSGRKAQQHQGRQVLRASIFTSIRIHRQISYDRARFVCGSRLPFVVTDSVAATVSTVLVPAQAIMIVLVCLVVIGVAARAIGFVSGRPPVDGLRVGSVTSRTVKVATVVLRLIGESSVTVIGRSPGIRNVAGIAFLRRAEVSRVCASCNDTVVAGRTRAKHLGVIDGQYGRKHVGRVAVLTDIRRLRVGRIFAGRICAVMAANTVARNIYMIEIRR